MLEWTLIEMLLNGDAYLIWKQENGINYKYFNFCHDTPGKILLYFMLFSNSKLRLLLALASNTLFIKFVLNYLKSYDFFLFYFRFGHCKYVIIHYISPTSLPSCIKCIWEIQMKGISRAAPELVSKIAND